MCLASLTPCLDPLAHLGPTFFLHAPELIETLGRTTKRFRPTRVDPAALPGSPLPTLLERAHDPSLHFLIGHMNGTFVHVPIAMAVGEKARMSVEGELWTGVLAATGQPRRFE